MNLLYQLKYLGGPCVSVLWKIKDLNFEMGMYNLEK